MLIPDNHANGYHDDSGGLPIPRTPIFVLGQGQFLPLDEFDEDEVVELLMTELELEENTNNGNYRGPEPGDSQPPIAVQTPNTLANAIHDDVAGGGDDRPGWHGCRGGCRAISA